MKRLLSALSVVLIPCCVFANTYILGISGSSKQNDWANASVAALYNFESGALTTDSVGTSTLTNNNTVVANTNIVKQGAASADFESGSTQYFSVTDANLDSGFPLKSGNTGTFSIACWIRAESLSADMNIWTKYDSAADARSITVVLLTTGVLRTRWGHTSGTAYQEITHGTSLSSATWYHLTITHDASDRGYRIAIRSTDGSVVGSDATGTLSNAMSITDAPFVIGAASDGTYTYDGLIDEFVVLDVELTSDNITSIAKGTFR